MDRIMGKGNQWLGVLLAGGKSSRMGKDKRFLEVGGESLLQRGIKLLTAAVGDGCVLVSGSIPGNREAVADFLPGLGPLGGLHSVLRTNRSREAEWMLLIPVDMPAMDSRILKSLMAIALERAPLCQAGLTFEGNLLPAVVRISPALRNSVAALCMAENDPRERSLKALWNILGLGCLQAKEVWKREFQNINTPEQWQIFLGGSDERSL